MNTSGTGMVNRTDFISANDSHSLPFWSSTIYLCIMSVITVISILGNGLLLTVQYYLENKTSTDWLVTFMAAIDLTTSVTEVSVVIVHFSVYAEDIGSDELCSVINYLRFTTQYASSLLLTAVAVERYFKTCRPHSTAFSTKRTTHLCIGITLVSCLPGIPILSSSNYQVAICRMTEQQSSPVIRILGNVTVTSYIAMFASLIVLYTKIGFAMRKRLNRVAGTRIEVSNSVRTDTTVDTAGQPGGSNEVDSDRRISPGQQALTIRSNIRDKTILQHTNRITSQHACALPISSNIRDNSLLPHTNRITSQQALPISSNRRDNALLPDTNRITSQQALPISSNRRDNALLQQTNHITSQEALTISSNRRDNALLQHTNRITFIMGLLTFVFSVTWNLFYVVHVLFRNHQSYSVKERILLLFQSILPLVNTITNPIFFTIMSSKFRQQSKVVLRKRYLSLKNQLCR